MTKPKGHNTSNITSLGSSNYYEDDGNYLPKNKVDENVTHRAEALKQLFKGKKNVTDVTRADFNSAAKSFPMHAVRADPGKDSDFRWRLKGMKCRLYNHQLLGAAAMRRLEKRGEAPFGGIQADAMGLGSISLLAFPRYAC